MRFRPSRWGADWFGEPQSRGFMWGVGTALAAYLLWPAVKEAVRPATKGVVRGAMAAGDKFRYAYSGARESLEDIVAEAQFERMRESVGDQVEAVGDKVADVIRPDQPPLKRDH